MKAEKPFATEAEMCARFTAALPAGWTPYAETAGWDILLVRATDGFQIGIQAKLRMNLDVINQAIEDRFAFAYSLEGPDCRAIMVPDVGTAPFEKICGYIGLTIVRVRGAFPRGISGPIFLPDLPETKITSAYAYEDWFELYSNRRHQLPEYIPDVAAGASAPLRLTDWKIRAIKIAVTIDIRGYVTREDFKRHRIDHRRWLTANGWLRREGGVFKANRMPDFKGQHPRVWEQIAAEAAKWMPPDPAPAKQEAML